MHTLKKTYRPKNQDSLAKSFCVGPYRKATFLLYLLCFFAFASATFAQTGVNPVLPNQADPDITYFNGRYYIYPTAVSNNQFRAYSSADLTNWRDEGVIFDLGPQCPWANGNGWAPATIYRNGKYYFYYTAEVKIGVAVGNTPIGPFVDKGSPLIGTDPHTDDIIDPYVFIDTDGQGYIYYGGSGKSKMVVRRLNADMVSVGEPMLLTPPNYTEGPCMTKRGNIYHLTYSNGAWFNGTYNVQYCTSNSPIGPWTYKGTILSSTGPFTGPGHHSIVQKPGCDEYYAAYHRYENGNYNTRMVAIDRVVFNDNGDMAPIKPTWAGVPARPGNAPCFNQRDLSNGTYKIVSRMTASTGEALILDIENCGVGAGDDVRTWTPSNCLGQQWTVSYDGNGYYEIVSQQPTRHALDLDNCLHDRRTNVKIWNDTNNDCQRWRIEPVGGGWYRILSKQSGFALDIVGCSNIPKANVGTWDWTGADCQQWKFEPIGGTFTSVIEAENYVAMAGIQTEGCAEGGLNVGWIETGDWMAYNITIPAAGEYTVTYRVASPNNGTSLRLEKDAGATNLGTVSIPNTGGWQNWTSVSHKVNLPAGQYAIGIATATGGFNINKFTISNNASARIDEDTIAQPSLSVYPNPVSSESFSVNYYSEYAQKVKVEFYNSLSKMEIEKEFLVKKGLNIISLESSTLINGVHFIKIKGEKSKIVSSKVLINK